MLSRFKLCCVFAALCVSVTGHALAITPPSDPVPTPTPTSSPSSTSAAEASATSSAQAGATANAQQAQGQQQGQGQGQSQSSTGGTMSDSSSSRFNAYALPAPVFTPPMARVECPTPRIENRAFSVGWGFVSAARGDTTTDDCTAIALRNAYVEQCQYASAKQVQDLLTAKVLPGFKSSTVVYLDLTQGECTALKAPPLPPAPPQIIYVPAAAAPAASAPPPAPPVVRKKVVRRRAVAPACATAAAALQQCQKG